MIRHVVARKVSEIERRSEEDSLLLDAVVHHLSDSPCSVLRCIKSLMFDLLFAALVIVTVIARVCWRNLAILSLGALLVIAVIFVSDLIACFRAMVKGVAWGVL